MNARKPFVEAAPRYCTLFDKHVLANWIALIAEDRDLDVDDVAALTGLDTGTVQAILEGKVSTLSVRMLDDALRAVERRPKCGTHVGSDVLRPAHAEAPGVPV